MCKFNSGGTWQSLRVLCILMALVLCLTQVMVNATSSSTCNSSSSSGCTLREWLIKLQEESYSLECTLSQLEKSTTLLSKVNYSTTSMRLNQITKLKKTISNLKGEIEIINLTCSTFYGPDCNLTTPECNSKCLTCASPGICSNCTGNWDGPTCSVCKSGWNGTDCNTPICSSNCASCSSPNVCPTCKSGWTGTSCNSPICGANCALCSSPNVCSVCKSGWSGSDCNTPVCSSNCASCSAPNVCPTCNSGWYGSDCNSAFPLILSSAQITKFTSLIMSNATFTTSKLLFKASKDGFTANSFHSKCDNKGPTIVIIKANTGAIFGGYTSASWQSQGGDVTDNSAFLFSLVSNAGVERFTKLTFQNSYYYKTGHTSANSAIINLAGYGPIFGSGNDIYISDNASSGSTSHTFLCFTFCDETMAYNTDAAKTYLTGLNSFQVADYEVYSL